MKVVFLQDVQGVAQGGDVKEVRAGFARNYLLPKQLAVPATRNALQRVERLTREAGGERLRMLADMKALAQELDGAQVNVEMRAGASGRLYGSVTNAIIATELSSMTAREIDRRTVELTEPLREVGVFDVRVRLHAEVDASVKVVVHPTGSDPMDVLTAGEAKEGEEEAAPEQPAEAVAAAVAQDAEGEMQAPEAVAAAVGQDAEEVVKAAEASDDQGAAEEPTNEGTAEPEASDPGDPPPTETAEE